jgi:hypothetical protein
MSKRFEIPMKKLSNKRAQKTRREDEINEINSKTDINSGITDTTTTISIPIECKIDCDRNIDKFSCKKSKEKCK